MFGTYRTLLAMMVVVFHLGGVFALGYYAVFGFYILSGYLMTYIMQNNYGYNLRGRASYALNRFLRIYPVYWVSAVVSLLLIYIFGQQYTTYYHSQIYTPNNLESILRNIFLFFPNKQSPMLTPPAWALTVELFFYICIGLGLSKNPRITFVWFVISVIYTIWLNFKGLGLEYRYFSIVAASLPFSTGALVFHYRHKFKEITRPYSYNRYAPVLLYAFICLNWFVGYFMGTLEGISFYINYLLCALMIILLFDIQDLPFISRRLDKLLGDFSYPIYVIHLQTGLVVLFVISLAGFEIKRRGLVLAFVSLPVIFLFSWLITVSVERPVELIRNRVRPRYTRK